MRRVIPKGLVFTVDLSKLADRELPEGSEMTVDEYRRTIEAPIYSQIQESTFIDWGDGQTSIVNPNDSSFPAHTYADGTGNVFRITIRSATGHLPFLGFNSGQIYNVDPLLNLSHAVISIDHYCGAIGNSYTSNANYLARNCYNLRYIDPRLPGDIKYISHDYSMGVGVINKSGSLEQPIDSFCFDYQSACTNYSFVFREQRKIYGAIPTGFFDNNTETGYFRAMFYNCFSITNIPSDLFDKCKKTVSFQGTFQGCIGLTGAPYVFWKADGSLDNDKFPLLTTAGGTYSSASAEIRVQVPEAYGGTMTV